jgi:hypothetical protein
MGSENSSIKRNEKKMAKKKGFFNYWVNVRALANRDYLGDWFARITHVGHSPFACIAPKILPGKAFSITRLKSAVTLRAI